MRKQRDSLKTPQAALGPSDRLPVQRLRRPTQSMSVRSEWDSVLFSLSPPLFGGTVLMAGIECNARTWRLVVIVDLRSDTCSRPTEAMRHAMATAAVGDDVYSEDPTVRLLEERTAALLGKEDAVYMVTGTMTNQVAIRAHTEPGNAVLFDQNAHVCAKTASRSHPRRAFSINYHVIVHCHGTGRGFESDQTSVSYMQLAR